MKKENRQYMSAKDAKAFALKQLEEFRAKLTAPEEIAVVDLAMALLSPYYDWLIKNARLAPNLVFSCVVKVATDLIADCASTICDDDLPRLTEMADQIADGVRENYLADILRIAAARESGAPIVTIRKADA